MRRTSLPWLPNIPQFLPDQVLQIAGPLVAGAEQYGRHHLQVRLNFPQIRNGSARVASPPLPKRNAANVLLEHTSLAVRPPRDTNAPLSLGHGAKGGREELRRIALILFNGKICVVKQPRARGGSQRRVVVDPPALDRESRGLSSERAGRAICRVTPAVLGVNIEKPTEGSQAQQHLRDCIHEASMAVEVANAHARAAAAVPLQLPGDLLLGHAVSCHA